VDRLVCYLRAVLEVVCSAADSKQVSRDPDEAQSARGRRFVLSTPAACSSAWVMVGWRDIKAPAVEPQWFKENLVLLAPASWRLGCEGCHAEPAFPSSGERDPQAHALCHPLTATRKRGGVPSWTWMLPV